MSDDKSPQTHKAKNRCETCEHGFADVVGVGTEGVKISQHKCKRSPHNAVMLARLWDYIEQKGCKDWIDKNKVLAPKPDVKVPASVPKLDVMKPCEQEIVHMQNESGRLERPLEK